MNNRLQKTLGLLGFAVSVAIVVAIVSTLNLTEFWDVLGGADYRFLPLLILLMILTNVFRALRWKILLPVETEVRSARLFESLMVGFTATFILPLRAGELVRALYLSKLEPVSFSGAIASVVTERVFDLVSLLVLVGVCFAFLPSVPPLVSIGAKSLLTVILLASTMLMISYRSARTLLRIVLVMCRLLSFSPRSRFSRRMIAIAREFTSGLSAVKTPKQLWSVLAYSGCVWMSIWCFYWISLLSLHLKSGFLSGAVVTSMIALAIAAPSAPGFIGTYQAGCIIALTTIYGFSESYAIAYSVFTHVVQAIFIIGMGFFYLLKRGLHLRDFVQRDAHLQVAGIDGN